MKKIALSLIATAFIATTAPAFAADNTTETARVSPSDSGKRAKAAKVSKTKKHVKKTQKKRVKKGAKKAVRT